MKKNFFILFLLPVSLLIQAQIKPKKIKTKSDYKHKATDINFPLKIDKYNRTNISAFDKKKQNIGVTYKDNNSKTVISIYLYPAGAATEDRLRNEYLKSMQYIANLSDNGINAKQSPIFHKNENYKINGFNAIINDINKKSSLSIFECGEWFFKIRITSEVLNTIDIKQIEQKILYLYKPTRLVKLSHLNHKADVNFNKVAFVDSVMLGSAMGSAFKKIDWVMNNVDSLERASGFPGLYLEMHIESLKEFTKFEKRFPNISKTKHTKKYLSELKSIINNGFLEEFIMEQFNMVMIVPDNLEFNFKEFKQWKINNPISINLNEKFYVIGFNKK